MNVMKKLFIADNDELAQSYYRAKLPARHCYIPDIQITLDKTIDPAEVDGILLHRVVKAQWMSVFDSLSHKITIEFDDDVWNIPWWNPAITAYTPVVLDIFDHTLSTCKKIIVSTEALKQSTEEHFGEKMDKIRVCPNLLDRDDWRLRRREKMEEEGITILWQGSAHHQLDIDEVVEPVKALLEEYGDKIKVLFFGGLPYALTTWHPVIGTNFALQSPDAKYSNLGYVKPVDLKFYPAAMMDIAPDICIAPLCNEKFNNSKSNIKVLEGAMAGAACVATDLPPYQNIPGPRVQPGDEDGWYKTLKTLIDDADMRHDIAVQQKQITMLDWTWENLEKRSLWEKTLGELV
jgi:O-antigen biosynthesis protein